MFRLWGRCWSRLWNLYIVTGCSADIGCMVESIVRLSWVVFRLRGCWFRLWGSWHRLRGRYWHRCDSMVEIVVLTWVVFYLGLRGRCGFRLWGRRRWLRGLNRHRLRGHWRHRWGRLLLLLWGRRRPDWLSIVRLREGLRPWVHRLHHRLRHGRLLRRFGLLRYY